MSEAPPTAILHNYWRSSCSYRVRIALNLKGIAYKYVIVNLLEEKHIAADYAKKNPSKVVPTLEIDGEILSQSLAILEYLEETRPHIKPLLPKDPVQRAKVRQIMQIIGSDIQPVHNLRVLKHANVTGDEEKKKEWVQWAIQNGFDALEPILKETSVEYSVGKEITFADICLVPQVYAAERFGFATPENRTKYSKIFEIAEKLNKLEAFQNAHPDQQPDHVPPKN